MAPSAAKTKPDSGWVAWAQRDWRSASFLAILAAQAVLVTTLALATRARRRTRREKEISERVCPPERSSVEADTEEVLWTRAENLPPAPTDAPLV